MNGNFTLFQKLNFFFFYFWYRVLIPLEVKKGKIAIIYAEIIWIVNHIMKIHVSFPKQFSRDYIITKYGKFYIPPDLISTITVSPAFERLDIEYLLRIIKQETKKRKKVLFMDIGANFGLYTILVARKFRNTHVLSFEPDTKYITIPTFNILKRNIIENNLHNVKVFKKGIGTKKGVNTAGIRVSKLDKIIGKNYLTKYDCVFIKLDIDEFVLDGLYGIKDALPPNVRTYLLVEDFIKPKEIKKWLEKNNFHFLKKLTPYNSFWYL